jgi:hypothetical protein
MYKVLPKPTKTLILKVATALFADRECFTLDILESQSHALNSRCKTKGQVTLMFYVYTYW